MGFADLWSRTLVYFGIAEEEEWDEDGYATTEQIEEYGRGRGDVEEESHGRRNRQNVRRLPSAPEADEWSAEDAAPAPAQRSRRRREQREAQAPRPRLRSVDPGPPAKVHLVIPRSFNDAQQIADRFKDGVPVILNLQSADPELSMGTSQDWHVAVEEGATLIRIGSTLYDSA